MTNSDYIEVRGPNSLAELVAVIDPSAPRPEVDLVTLELGGDEYAAVQYDGVDKDSWPYMNHHRVPVGGRGAGPSPGHADFGESGCCGLGLPDDVRRGRLALD